MIITIMNKGTVLVLMIVLPICALLCASAQAAPEKPAAKPAGQRFEISFPKEASTAALDGHVLLLISNNDEKEPRFQSAL